MIPLKGRGTKKTRPALIISNDIGNETANIVIVAPITNKVKNVYPFEVKVSIQGKSGKIMLNQCRAADKSRLTSKLDEVNLEQMKSVEEAIKIVFALT